ncbi:CHAT domain-containing protein [Oscillatoria acuminata]|uniref:CHAT domain-containing protein n=1 Tax=Oscillatoria acuminata PCC 6304 TaxID=56110 RepID=K9TFV0_9CYAN|nr:CHAT domain-containing protein [Oscillatoria acuminata]AFY81016.1 hypothetical protein Oscil6304_1303 [Oscillatoria acuminata PCC 6304]
MNEQRIEAYRNLIQQLLTCPNGEAPQILNQSRELVDEGFVQVCEQVAQQLQQAGEENKAGFLRTLAQQVAAFLNPQPSGGEPESRETPAHATEEDYFNFLMDVLQATHDSQGNPSVVYPLLQQNLDKLDLKLADILHDLASQTLKQVEKNQAVIMAVDIGNFANLIQKFTWGSPGNNLEIAIVGYEISLTIFSKNKNPDDWAGLNNNLGNAYIERSNGEPSDNTQRAIAAYQRTLEVYSRTTFPEEWAMAQYNLGNAYCRSTDKQEENLDRSITFFQSALEVYSRNNFPKQWAMTQSNLGNAYFYRITGNRAQDIEKAIAAYRFALQVYTRKAYPEKWARTQNNLGNAYRKRIKGEQSDNIQQAIDACKAALEVYTRTSFPEQWAETQANLGNAYSEFIRGDQLVNLKLGIEACNKALEVYTPSAFPKEWAKVHICLGNIYCQPMRQVREENLEKGIVAYQFALKALNRKASPKDWAMTQNNLGLAYYYRIKGDRSDNIERAIITYQAALKVYTHPDFPADWAMTKNNLGMAYCYRIKGTQDDNIKKAISAYTEALDVYTLERFPQRYATIIFNLGIAYRKGTQFKKSYTSFASAIDTVEEIRSNIIIGGEADKQKLAEKWQKLYGNMVEVCLELENYSAAVEYAERSKARNLVELMAATRLKPPGVSSEVWERYDALSQKLWNLQQQRDSSTSSKLLSSEVTPQLTQLRQQIDTLIAAEITPHDPKFRFGQRVQPIPYRKIQALVDDNTAIVEWYFTSKGIQAFIVTRQGEPIFVSTDKGALDELAGLTNEYLRAYTDNLRAYTDNRQWRQQLPSYLQRLAEILKLDQLLSRIPSHCQELVLVPYRFLHLFPLHALPVSKTEYLSDKFPQGIRYVPSSQILQLSLSQASTPFGKGGKEKSLFAIQNPTTESTLRYADIEVEAIQTQFHPVTVLKGDAASKTGFNQAATLLKDAAFVHFSCHGSFDFANPRNSGLILADAKLSETTATEEGVPRIRSQRGEFNPSECLTLPEIFNLRFRQCRLVALSACETGITDITTTSDEYISILAGFFFAGSRNVLGTLWAVNDLSTAMFMIHFYETLLGEKQPPVALAVKQTQEWMRQVTVAQLLEWIAGCRLIGEQRREEMCDYLRLGYKTKLDVKRFESPYYWAAFCAVGQ